MSSNISRRKVLRIGVISTTGAAALLSVLGSGLAFGQQAGDQSGGSAGASVTAYVFKAAQGIKGPDGKTHDSFVPSSFVLQSGVPTTLNIINYDDGLHSMTSPDLGLNLLIAPGNAVGNAVQPVTTTATITVPQSGVYRWYCSNSCDDGAGNWAMSDGLDGKDQDGFMAGNFVVL
jgi:heme/copper-type cytochrome/quinol oxidase subunit 2